MNSIYVFAVVLMAAAAADAGRTKSALRRSLFADYDKLVKPDEGITVNVGINVIGMGYCPHKEVLTLNGWIRNIWNDSRLTWDKDEWGGINRIRVPASELWRPDVTLYNSVGRVEADYLSWEGTSRAVIINTGTVIFVPPVTYRSKCPSKADPTENAIFADHECKLKIGSWTYDQSEMDIDAPETFGMSPLDFTLFQEKNYKVLDSSVTREEKEYPCCPGEIYPNMNFNIKFKRTAKMNSEGKMEFGEDV